MDKNVQSPTRTSFNRTQDVFVDLWMKIRQFTKPVRTSDLTFTESKYSTKPTAHWSIGVDQDFVCIDSDLLNVLDVDELKLVSQICKDLKFNCAFWRFDYQAAPARLRRTVSKLTSREFLYPTDTRHLYIVNPLKLRKGTPHKVLVASSEYIKGLSDWKDFEIKGLKAPQTAMNDMLSLLRKEIDELFAEK